MKRKKTKKPTIRIVRAQKGKQKKVGKGRWRFYLQVPYTIEVPLGRKAADRKLEDSFTHRKQFKTYL